MTYFDDALDDLDAADLRAFVLAATEKRNAAVEAGAHRWALVWNAMADAAAEAEDRRKAALRALENDLLGLPPASDS